MAAATENRAAPVKTLHDLLSKAREDGTLVYRAVRDGRMIAGVTGTSDTDAVRELQTILSPQDTARGYDIEKSDPSRSHPECKTPSGYYDEPHLAGLCPRYRELRAILAAARS